MDLESLSVAQLHKVRPLLGEALQEKIDGLIESKSRDMARGVATEAKKRRGQPNKTEQQYMNELLHRPDVASVDFEAVKFRLADGAWYTPDVLVRFKDGTIEFHEVKGFWREAAMVRIKVVAQTFPYWTFRAVQKRKKKQGGGWKIRTFDPNGHHYEQPLSTLSH